MARLFRCYNPKCADSAALPGHDFAAEEPKCPKCKTSADHPRFGHLITPLKLIHFEVESAVGGAGVGYPACQQPTGNENNVRGNFRSSGAPDAVNCPACRETKAFKAALHAQKFDPADDIPLKVNLASGVLVKSKEESEACC